MTSTIRRGAVLALVMLLTACGAATAPTPIPALTVTCPTDIHVGSVVAPTSTVSFPLPTTTGGKPPVSVTCLPASNASFPLGTTTVTCTGTDVIHTASCTFRVTLVPPQAVISVQHFLAFGDSITAGENGEGSFTLVDSQNAYPTLLGGLLTARYTRQSPTVTNCGVPGETADQGKARIDQVLGFYNPDVLLLLEGVNSLTGSVATDAGSIQGDLANDIDIARAHGLAGVFLSTLLPMNPDGRRAKETFPDEIVPINFVIRSMASQQGVTLVDNYAAFAGHPEYLDDDGLHPLPIGNQVMAQQFFAAIQAKFEILQPTLRRGVTAGPIGVSDLCPDDKTSLRAAR